MTVFETPGKHNSEETLRLAVQEARDKGISSLVVASYTGYNASLLDGLDTGGLNIVIVTQTYGYAEVNGNPMSEEQRDALRVKGYSVVTATHVLSGAERGLSRVFSGIYPVEILANALRMFGHGTKVCVEISTMAADAGYVRAGERVVAVAGTGRGADTALVLRPGHGGRILDTRIDYHICKPIVPQVQEQR